MNNTRYTDRDLIEAVLSEFYIVDYGYISEVNADNTVNVVHAVKPVLRNGEKLAQTETKNMELLFLSGAGFCLSWDVKEGDRVLLVGLKDYVKNTGEVQQAKDPQVYIHYNRSTLKAVPFCAIDTNAAVKIKVKDGTLAIDTQGKIELNGASKQFVTFAELNGALQALVSAINSHTHIVSGTAGPVPVTGNTAVPTVPATLDISAAQTQTVVTGG